MHTPFFCTPNVALRSYRASYPTPPTPLHTEHCLGNNIGDKGAVALAPAISELKDLTTLVIDGKIANTPCVMQGE